MSDSLPPYGLQHARPPCPSPTPGVYPNSCPLSQWCHPTISSSPIPFSSCLQSFPASYESYESTLCIRWPKYWSFNFNISPSNEHSGLISFRMDWLDLLAVQGILKSLLQYHSSKASTCQQGHSPSEICRGESFLWCGVAIPHILWLLDPVLQSLPPLSHGHRFPICLCLLL